MGKGSKIVLGVVGSLVLIGGCNAAMDAGDGGSDMTRPDDRGAVNVSEAPDAPAAPVKSQAERFIECVESSGTPSEKAAMKHVIKVTGTDRKNNIADVAEVHTNLKGDLVSGDAGTGKLIASAFVSCFESNNGLVTIYNESGEILSNGNF